MRLKFLGTGSAYNPTWGNNAAFFTLKDQLYLVDCGENVFTRIINRPELADCRAVNVLVTHFHADHIGSLSSFIAYCAHVLAKPVLVATPNDTLVTILRLMGVGDENYVFRQDFSEPFPGGLTVTPVKVRHAADMDCYGYYLRDSRETVFYGGDSEAVPDQVLGRLIAGDVALVYQETTYEKGCHAGHCSLEQLCLAVPQNVRNRVVCMHFNNDFLDAVRAKGFRAARR